MIPPPAASTPWPVWTPHDTPIGRTWVLTTAPVEPARDAAIRWTLWDYAIAGVVLLALAVTAWLVRHEPKSWHDYDLGRHAHPAWAIGTTELAQAMDEWTANDAASRVGAPR